MKHAAYRSFLVLGLVLPAAGSWAANGEARPAARPLDLTVPRDVVGPVANDGPFAPGATRYGMGYEARRNLEAGTGTGTPAPGAGFAAPSRSSAGSGEMRGRGAGPTPVSAGGSRAGGGGRRR